MKSQGWPERVQIGLMVGDFMEKIETAYQEELNALGSGDKKTKTKKKVQEGPNKFAGFQAI